MYIILIVHPLGRQKRSNTAARTLRHATAPRAPSPLSFCTASLKSVVAFTRWPVKLSCGWALFASCQIALAAHKHLQSNLYSRMVAFDVFRGGEKLETLNMDPSKDTFTVATLDLSFHKNEK